jgi:DHA1 family inner membrane transport protein
MASQARSALTPRVLAMLGFGLVVVGGQFTAFTFLAPFLERVTGVPAALVSVFLLAYGVAAAAGTFGGGRLADRSPAATIIEATVVLVAALGTLLLAGRVSALTLVALAVWGMAGFGLVPAFQLRVISLAGPGGDLAATLGASAVNAGIAAGAAAGGWVVASHGVRGTVGVALVCCAAMIPAGAAAGLLKIPRTADAEAPARVGGSAAAAQACCRVSGRIQVHLLAHGHPQNTGAPGWWRLSPWPMAETSGARPGRDGREESGDCGNGSDRPRGW